jgi:hypothetical protein
VREVLETGRHPWLRWPELSDVAPALRELYGHDQALDEALARGYPYPEAG